MPWLDGEARSTGDARPELRHVALTPEGPQLRPGLDWSPRHRAGVMVRPLMLGICRSDYKEAARQRQGASQFGHEVVGEVIAHWGKAPFEVGDRVCLDPNRPLNRGTAFADLMPADGTEKELAEALHWVPRTVSLERAVFAEPLACAVHCLDRVTQALGGQISGRHVLVVGAGIAGTLIALSARAAGATVSLRNASPDKLEFLRETGLLAAEALGRDEPPRTPPEAIVLATAFIEARWLRWALDTVTPDGAILLYGGTQQEDRFAEAGVELALDPLRRQEGSASVRWGRKPLTVAGSYGTEPSCFARGLRWLSAPDASWALERLVLRRIGLTELPVELSAGGPKPRPGKVLVVP
ncbi:alcohol dehydrogenase catalytic domain-containing protein [Stigmatella sp. ncwal1]|uniref:Alcohol dehydrogenase catalytic domain-containing protein n=1 Tax=Stigmatella ashevillensis TaxID=2995309 RepID=A0ABT5DQX7_9BACT|nr:alcohol dehydrogenase catalytic domain-containing protein [Stigmatella ashevillena]MDC0714797.1 alcohol dehydrogenase catalytic domain-containing protein [Stigmatella ashevillena]